MRKRSRAGLCCEGEVGVMVIFLCLLVNWGNKRGPKERHRGNSWQVADAVQHSQKLPELVPTWPKMRPEWSLWLSLERPCSSAAPCGCGHLLSFPSSLLMLLAGCILLQKGFLELGFGFLFGVQHLVLFFSCTVAFRSWETTDLSLCRTWSTSPIPFALFPVGDLTGTALVLWPSNWHQRGDVALNLCLGVRCSEQLSKSGRNRSYIGGRSIDEPTFMWSQQRLTYVLHQPLPLDFFRGFQFLLLEEQAVMHHFPELLCCISLVQASQQGVWIQRTVIVHMAGMGSASQEVCFCARPGRTSVSKLPQQHWGWNIKFATYIKFFK